MYLHHGYICKTDVSRWIYLQHRCIYVDISTTQMYLYHGYILYRQVPIIKKNSNLLKLNIWFLLSGKRCGNSLMTRFPLIPDTPVSMHDAEQQVPSIQNAWADSDAPHASPITSPDGRIVERRTDGHTDEGFLNVRGKEGYYVGFVTWSFSQVCPWNLMLNDS